ncbi:MAG TPA: hypothetical protein VFK38_01945 [Candidatus Limnocylindrales bacterium]|nr:hypothetical protein [Candidatus Limnocylindrales bacterium]
MQANHIILRISADRADEFERLFEKGELPIWRDLAARGLLVHASMTRVAFGTEEREGVRHYAIYAAFTSMAGHTAHDSDPRFKAYDAEADAFQPQQPLVFGGRTLFEASGGDARAVEGVDEPHDD